MEHRTTSNNQMEAKPLFSDVQQENYNLTIITAVSAEGLINKAKVQLGWTYESSSIMEQEWTS